jgi:hypothetical protein
MKEEQAMLQKLMLAITMTFALNLFLGIRPPVVAPNAVSTNVIHLSLSYDRIGRF